MKRPLKWAGGKGWLTAKILKGECPELPLPKPGQVMVELFAGGAAMSFELELPLVILADVNFHLIEFYKSIRDGHFPDTTWMKPNPELFLRTRTRFNDLAQLGETDPSMFYYLVRSAYNGVCRFSRAGGFNAPFGLAPRYERDPEVWRGYQALMAEWSMVNFPWEQTLNVLAPGQFVYADPPYPDSNLGYYGDRLSMKDHMRLAYALRDYQGDVLVSNSPVLRELYASLGFTTEVTAAPRAIAANGDRTPALEMLAYKRS